MVLFPIPNTTINSAFALEQYTILCMYRMYSTRALQITEQLHVYLLNYSTILCPPAALLRIFTVPFKSLLRF